MTEIILICRITLTMPFLPVAQSENYTNRSRPGPGLVVRPISKEGFGMFDQFQLRLKPILGTTQKNFQEF